MFRRNSGDALVLEVEDETLTFPSSLDFDFALSGRTCLPAAKIAALVELPDEALLREAEQIRRVEQRLADALSGAMEDVTSIGPFLRQIDLAVISQDHGWRGIIAALNQTASRAHEEYKKIALVKYMQYLTSRQEVVKTLYANRRMHRGEGPQPEAQVDHKQRETLIFDIAALVDRRRGETNGFGRIPKGETLEIHLEPQQIVQLMLAGHRCSIVRRETLRFVDETGRDSGLEQGRNIVGRDANCDVVLNPQLRDVSRKHLIIETDGQGLVRITDISSHGTWAPAEFLERTSI